MSIKSAFHVPKNQLTVDFDVPIMVQQKMKETAILSTLKVYADVNGPIDVLINFGQILQNAVQLFKDTPEPVSNDDSKKISYYLQLQTKDRYLGKTYDPNVLFTFLSEKFCSEEYVGPVLSMHPGFNRFNKKNVCSIKGAYNAFGGFRTNNAFGGFRTKLYNQMKLPNGQSLKELGIGRSCWWKILDFAESQLKTFLFSDNPLWWRQWAEVNFFFQVKSPKKSHLSLQNVRPIVKMPMIVRITERWLANFVYNIFSNRIDSEMQASNQLTPKYRGYGLNHNCFQLEDFLRSDKEGIALFFDIRKAYSSVDHETLLEILKTSIPDHEDPNQLIYKYAANYYRNAHYNIGDRTVFIRRGVLQGSTLANYFFIIYMDAFLKDLKNRLSVLGVLPNMFYGPDHSIKAFVDDIVIYCPKNDPMAIMAVNMTIQSVAKDFKLELNVGKSRYITNDGTQMKVMCNNLPVPVFKQGEKYLGRFVVQPPELVAEVFIQHQLHPLMEKINAKTKNRMKYYRKSIGSRVFTQFVKTAAPPAFLDMVSAFETGYLINWGMSAEEVSKFLYARNFTFIRERRYKLLQFIDKGIDTPYINALVDDNTGYRNNPEVDYEMAKKDLDDLDYAKLESA